MTPAKIRALWYLLEDQLFNQTLDHSDLLFNPYNQIQPGIDVSHANQIRQQNLKNYLSSFQTTPTAMIIGEAPGWRGCRFTGVPFTSEAMYINGQLPFQGFPTSLHNRFYAESSATIFWRVMRPYHPLFFAWNCLPYHPHQLSEHLSNRRPTKTEIQTHLHLLGSILGIMKPEKVIAVGRRAEFALAELGVPAKYIRHPSHGGAIAFKIGIDASVF